MGGDILFTHPEAPVPRRTVTAASRRHQFTAWWKRHASRPWNQIVLVVCIASAVIYVIDTYHDESYELWSKILEVMFGAFFALDYFLRFYAADNRVDFVLNVLNVLDFVTILPAVFLLAVPRSSEAARFVFFFQVLRVVRVVRILRGYRVVSVKSRSGDPRSVRNQVLLLCYTLLAMIFISAALVQLVEEQTDWFLEDANPNATNPVAEFHNSIYLMVITLTTVGYGDITPQTFMGKIFIMVFVVVSLVVIPMETGKISALIALTSPYGGHYDTLERHVIVGGHIEFSNLKAFLNEFFHPAHGRSQPNVVVIAPGQPGKAIRVLLGENGVFGKRVQYFEGSLLDEHDLARVAYHRALACFFLSDRNSFDRYVADCETNMRVRSVKNYNRQVPVLAQINLETSRIEAVQSGVDYFICLGGLKQRILAISSQVHGFSTLFCNLFRNEAFVFEEPGHWLSEYCHGISYEVYTMTFSPAFVGKAFGIVSYFIYAQYSTLLLGVRRHSANGDSQVLLNPWSEHGDLIIEEEDVGFVFATDSDVPRQISEYQGDLILTEADLKHDVFADVEGLSPQMTRVPSRGPSTVAQAFGVPRKPGAGSPKKKAHGGLGVGGDVNAGAGDGVGGAAAAANGGSSSTGGDGGGGGEKVRDKEQSPNLHLAVPPVSEGHGAQRGLRGSLSGDLAAAGVNFVPELEDSTTDVRDLPPLVPMAVTQTIMPPATPATLRGGSCSVISRGRTTFSGFRQSLRNNRSSDLVGGVSGAPATQQRSMESVHTSSLRQTAIERHTIIVFPEDYPMLFSYVKILRKEFDVGAAQHDPEKLKLIAPIIVMFPTPLTHEQHNDIAAYPEVYVCCSNGKAHEDWEVCNVRAARAVLILRNDRAGALYDANRSSSDSALMGDFDALSVWFALESVIGDDPQDGPFVITELQSNENLKYFRPRHNSAYGAVTDSNDYIVPVYASGRVYSDAGMDSLLCQVFYSPHLFLLLQQFLNPRKMPTPDGYVSCAIYSMSIPQAWVGATFSNILQELAMGPHRWLPIGLYRHPDTEEIRAAARRRRRSSNSSVNSLGEHRPSQTYRRTSAFKEHTPGFLDGATFGEAPPPPSYVFLCPPPSTVLREDDLLYVFADRDPRLVYGGVFCDNARWPRRETNLESSQRSDSLDGKDGFVFEAAEWPDPRRQPSGVNPLVPAEPSEIDRGGRQSRRPPSVNVADDSEPAGVYCARRPMSPHSSPRAAHSPAARRASPHNITPRSRGQQDAPQPLQQLHMLKLAPSVSTRTLE